VPPASGPPSSDKGPQVLTSRLQLISHSLGGITTVPAKRESDLAPGKIKTRIRAAWIVTMLIGCGTVAGYLAALVGLPLPFRATPMLLVRAGVILFLAWGIRRHSRTAIILMLAILLGSRLDLVLRFPGTDVRLIAGISLVVFGYVLVQGARAIFALHGRPPESLAPDAA
jgi:hypothetical protein